MSIFFRSSYLVLNFWSLDPFLLDTTSNWSDRVVCEWHKAWELTRKLKTVSTMESLAMTLGLLGTPTIQINNNIFKNTKNFFRELLIPSPSSVYSICHTFIWSENLPEFYVLSHLPEIQPACVWFSYFLQELFISALNKFQLEESCHIAKEKAITCY